MKKLLCHILSFTILTTFMSTVPTISKASGIDNIIARADYLYNIKWTAQKDVYGWKNRESSKFIKGQEYRIPYGQPVSSGKYICWGVSVDDFCKATTDKNSVFYTKRSAYGTAESVYYAMDCSAFVSYCWNLPSRTTTTNWSNLSVTNYGSCTKTNIQKLKKGDALNLSGSHIVLVTDIIKNNNEIIKIEITEQTPPQLKRTVYTVSELASNYSAYTIYRYKNAEDVTSPPIIPSTPKISSVSTNSATEITLKWNAVSNADTYIINGRKAGGSYEKIKEVSGTSFTHTGLDTGCLYWYKIQAKNKFGSSGWSTAGGAYTKPKTPSTSNARTNSLTVNWTSDADGASSYELLVRKSGDSEYTTVATNIEGYTYTQTGLEAGTQYYYKIKAHNTEQTSIVSQRSDAGYGITKLSAPIATSISSRNISLDWSRGPLNGDYTYTYRVYRKEAAASNYASIAVTSNSSLSDTGLKPNTTYYYYIDVLRNGEWCINSERITVTTAPQPAESISISTNKLTLALGDAYTLYATILPADTTNKYISWYSSNENIVGVSNGILSANGVGSTTITAKTANGIEAYCAITVDTKENLCTHSYGNWIITTNASCLKNGKQTRSCSKCGKTETNIIPSTGHNYSAEWTITKEAHCNAYGEKKHLCSQCGDADISTIEIIEKPPHTPSDTLFVEKPATCTEEGIQYKLCTVCSEKCETSEIPPIEHLYDDNWIVEQDATCQHEKIEYRECLHCSEKEYLYGEKAEHNYILVASKDATISETGYVTYSCSWCELTYTDTIPVLEKLCCDVNCDGEIRINDLILLISHLNFSTALTEHGAYNADISGDGKIRMNDLIMLLNFLSSNEQI